MNPALLALIPLLAGFCADLIIGDPHGFPHPIVLIGKLISALESLLRRIFPKSAAGERTAGALLWLLVSAASFLLPMLLISVLRRLNPWLALAAEAVMCWQILATKALKDEALKVFRALAQGDTKKARLAVSMIVGRDTERLEADGIARAAIETVAENASDGVIAPMLFIAIGGAPLGFLYKAVNTMDSMLGYKSEKYLNFGSVPARADDLFNYLPSRLCALVMLFAGALTGMDLKNGWKIFLRDRYRHASPNSAQTESVCAGLLGIRLAGDAWYGGELRKKEFIGDALKEVEASDIPKACKLLYASVFAFLPAACAIRLAVSSFFGA